MGKRRLSSIYNPSKRKDVSYVLAADLIEPPQTKEQAAGQMRSRGLGGGGPELDLSSI